MPGPAVWSGSGSGSSSGNSSSGSSAGELTAPSSSDKSVAAHDDSNCNNKKTARGRRAFRESIRQE